MRQGYVIPVDSLPLSVENAQTDYADVDSEIVFRLTNGHRLKLHFIRDGTCLLIPEAPGKRLDSAASFRSSFPITVGVVPVLGPLEHQEEELTDATVSRNIATHRASRHFRNYWFKNPEHFVDFARLVESTWPGMAVTRPERGGQFSDKLVMFCREHGLTRELYWAGFGFQVWCQLLTHLVRTSSASVIAVDEPEIYLHPDIQRQLLGILRKLGPDVVIATHSTEIIAEADPSEILIVDKSTRSAKRVRDVEGIQEAYDYIGSIQNVSLTYLARNRRLLYLESEEDFRLLRRFAGVLGLEALSNGTGLTPVASEGFSSWSRVQAFAQESTVLLGKDLLIAAVYDRDYWQDDYLERVASEVGKYLEFIHFHDRKEFENYLLVCPALDRALERAVAERCRRQGLSGPELETAASLLEALTSPLRNEVQGQLVAKAYETTQGGLDKATIATRVSERFDSDWSELETRLRIVPGKRVLKDLRTLVREKYAVNLTTTKIVDAMRRDELAPDLVALLELIDGFRHKVTN